jgi:hypothetical protein
MSSTRRPSLRRTRGRLTAVGFLLAASVAATGCGSAKTVQPAAAHLLNTVKIEHAIALSSLHQRGKTVRVSCPAKVLQKKGVVFYCEARYKQSRTPFKVTEENGLGNVHYLAQ